MKTIAISTAAAIALGVTGASAQVLQERNISMALAQEIALEAVKACAAQKYNVTATVVDRAGVVRAVLRADNAGPHTVSASRAKAFTSVSTRNKSSGVMATSQKNPGAQHLSAIEGFLLLGGGVPIKAGNDVIGAIGIGGAPGGHLDEKCADTALEKVKAKLK